MLPLNEALEWISGYSRINWPIFPTNGDKSPATKNGFKDATTNMEILNSWFSSGDFNIAVSTGPANLLVIDIDDELEYQKLELIYGPLPPTVEQTTGRGRQLFFKCPQGVKFKAKICSGIDIKGPGGYVVIPPSVHANGKKYSWKCGPWKMSPVELPETWLQVVIKDEKNQPDKEFSSQFHLEGELIPEGTRNVTLFRVACSLRAKGLTESAIFAALSEVNEKQCIPPVGDNELKTTFESAMKYKPGQLQIATGAKSDFSKLPSDKGKVICLDDVEAEEVEWLWWPYIPLGKLTLIQGDPGDGKTTVVLNIAANISTGRALPGIETIPPGNVIYQTAEDGIADTIKPRLIAAVADCKRIFIIDESEKGLSLSDERIESAMIELRPKLFIIDPLQAYLGEKVDMHRANEVRPVLKKIGLLAEKYNCAVIMIMHLSKASQSRSLYRGLGSIDIPAAARSILLVGKNPSNHQERAIAHVKSSLAPTGPSLGFEITNFGVLWKGQSSLTADDMLGNASKAEDELDKAPINEARKYLISSLLEGPKPAKEILDSVKFLGFSTATLKRAKIALKIQSYKEGDIWLWRFPPDMEFEEDQNDE